MPLLLLSLLERRYLADFQSALWQVSPAPADSARPLLREVRGMGRPQAGEDRSRAMPHVLTAAHGQGHAVVTAVYGDGSRHRIFVGDAGWRARPAAPPRTFSPGRPACSGRMYQDSTSPRRRR